ncbi:uncharacterized protein LOC122668656 [Telopea speciosissima]|uniref:uncharacterized protein LOC122668656 n=1 Tax=Telopea speciosissima TaxID=54955 RepID=UPI001CC66550|nr:uncharacterized protein LOC122668656 [Telopea speciosissima]
MAKEADLDHSSIAIIWEELRFLRSCKLYLLLNATVQLLISLIYLLFFGAVIVADQNANCNGKFGVDYEWPLLDFGDGDNSLEQILWKIEIVQSRVHKLKTQLDKVMNSNAGRLSSAENLNLHLPSEVVPSSSARSPTVSLGKGYTTQTGFLHIPPPHVPEHEIGDLVMPESAVSSYGVANPLPDIIKITLELLSAADIALDQLQIGDSCEDIADDVLIHNQSIQEELLSFEKLKSHPLEKPCDPVKEKEKNRISPVSAPEPNFAQKTIVAQEQSTMKSCLASDFHVPKNKRKKGERKAGSGSWSKKSLGEPDH